MTKAKWWVAGLGWISEWTRRACQHKCLYVQVAVQMNMCMWVGLFAFAFWLATFPSLPLSSLSGKNFVWGFQKQDIGPTLNRGQLLSIKLTLSLFSSCYRLVSQANCLFLLFHFRCRMDISLSDGLILSKGLETALLRPFAKLQTLLLFSLSLI